MCLINLAESSFIFACDVFLWLSKTSPVFTKWNAINKKIINFHGDTDMVHHKFWGDTSSKNFDVWLIGFGFFSIANKTKLQSVFVPLVLTKINIIYAFSGTISYW